MHGFEDAGTAETVGLPGGV